MKMKTAYVAIGAYLLVGLVVGLTMSSAGAPTKFDQKMQKNGVPSNLLAQLALWPLGFL
jgi:hypothetical protein